MATSFDLSHLQDRIKSQGPDPRPIVVSLNGDNSWLWSFPRPVAERAKTGKAYFHLAFEPWLDGATGLFGPIGRWLVYFTLTSPPAATNGRDVDDIVQRIEEAWWTAHADEKRLKHYPGVLPGVDAILLGFHYSDHLHPPTLLTFSKIIPVVCTPQCLPDIQALKYLGNISVIPDVEATTASWQDLPHPEELPEWLQPVRMQGHHELNYLFALIWTHDSPSDGQGGGGKVHEAIYQSPHSLRLPLESNAPLQAFLGNTPLPRPLALFHGLKESHAANWKNTFGAESGLSLWRALGEPERSGFPWILSHNSALQYTGLVMWMLWVRDTPRTIDWALRREGGGKEGEARKGPEVVDVGNGRAFVL